MKLASSLRRCIRLGKALRSFPAASRGGIWSARLTFSPSGPGGLRRARQSGPSESSWSWLFLVWLGVNLVRHPNDFVGVFLVGVSQGSLYASSRSLHARLRHLELIKLAHGRRLHARWDGHRDARHSALRAHENPTFGGLIAHARFAAARSSPVRCSMQRLNELRTSPCATHRAWRR